ncbi:MAG TPA: alkaline phosphatase, partial [Polyangiaceae bacterium]|nr:alkaline phosphatase [Polyangiaceae bacterium]
MAAAAPTSITITPPNHTRFLVGQRFDIRVEGKGTGPFSASLKLDGRSIAFSSGEQNSTTTDGITSPGFGGFNLRGYSNLRPGKHLITATFSDATGTVETSSEFEVTRVGGYDAPIKNIIIMLGDGMGTAHRTGARLVRYGATAGDPNGYLEMDAFPSTGMVTTHSLNSIVTDSAPGMACYVTGSHANNGQEGVYPANVSSPFLYPRVEYLSEYLHRTQGKSLGLVSTADLEDATPAANAVHTGSRGAGTGIVDQYFDEADVRDSYRYGTGLRVLLGGGRRWFLPNSEFGSSRAQGSDYGPLPADLVTAWGLPGCSAGELDPERDLLEEMKASGFAYADTATSLSGLLAGSVPERLLGLFAYGNMNVALDKLAKRRNTMLAGTTSFVVDDYHAPDQPMLDDMTDAALRVLSRRNHRGFVLMVEGAHIDKQSHAMDAERAIGDTLEFDRAVGVARRFAENVDRSTLVLVLSDHECSGFSINGALNAAPEAVSALAGDGGFLDPEHQPARQKLVAVYESAGFPVYNILADGYPETWDVRGKVLFGFGANGDRFENWLTKPRPIVDSLLTSSIQTELADNGYPRNPSARSQSDGYFIR